MKKSLVFGFVLGFLLVSMFSFVSASQVSDVIKQGDAVIKEVVTALRPVVVSLVGNVSPIGDYSSEDIIFAKLLIFLLLLALVWTVAKKLPLVSEYTWVLWVVSVAIPLIAIRFMNAETIMFIVLPNSAFAVAISALLPLALYAYFVENAFRSPTLRKVAWAFAACVFVGLYFIRFESIGDLALVYLAAAALSIIILIIDGTIQSAIKRIRSEHVVAAHDLRREAELLDEFYEQRDRFAKGRMDKDHYKGLLDNLIERAETMGLEKAKATFKAAKQAVR